MYIKCIDSLFCKGVDKFVICYNCGTKLNDGSRFCSSCGVNLSNASNNEYSTIRKIQLRCNSCGGTMTGNATSPIINCPFCGSAEMIVESDTVKSQRIKSDERLTIVRENYDFEREKRNTLSAKQKIMVFAIGISVAIVIIACIIACFVENDTNLMLIILVVFFGWILYAALQ